MLIILFIFDVVCKVSGKINEENIVENVIVNINVDFKINDFINFWVYIIKLYEIFKFNF